MTEPTVSNAIDLNSARKVLSVKAPLPAAAWRRSPEQMGTAGPLARYGVGKANAAAEVGR